MAPLWGPLFLLLLAEEVLRVLRELVLLHGLGFLDLLTLHPAEQITVVMEV
jgi:hypothetical protein